jgi:hypothetical protein
VLRHAGLAEAEPADQLAHRPLALAKQVEDVAAVRLGEHLEGGHALDSIVPIGYMSRG